MGPTELFYEVIVTLGVIVSPQQNECSELLQGGAPCRIAQRCISSQSEGWMQVDGGQSSSPPHTHGCYIAYGLPMTQRRGSVFLRP